MKNKTLILFSLIFITLIFSLTACSDKKKDNKNITIIPELGVNYVSLNTVFPFQKPAKHEVLEFFSYSCIHCYRAQEAVSKYKKTKPDNVNFIQIPVAFGSTLYNQVFYTFKQLKVFDRMDSIFFDAIQKERLPIRTKEDFFAWMGDKGFNIEKVRNVFNSTTVQLKTNRSLVLVQKYQINSTPSFIVDGKYRTGPGFTHSHEKTMQLISLITQ